jgi:hypothetical protein
VVQFEVAAEAVGSKELAATYLEPRLVDAQEGHFVESISDIFRVSVSNQSCTACFFLSLTKRSAKPTVAMKMTIQNVRLNALDLTTSAKWFGIDITLP